MKPFGDPGEKYLEELDNRGKKSKAYTEHQLVGLEVAEILADRAHKALYIKLAKELGKEKILALAKSVAEKRDVRSKGAYFMRVLQGEKK